MPSLWNWTGARARREISKWWGWKTPDRSRALPVSGGKGGAEGWDFEPGNGTKRTNMGLAVGGAGANYHAVVI